MLIKPSANSPVWTYSLQKKHAHEFLRGSYSNRFQWFPQAGSTTGFQSWKTAKIAYYKISCTRKTYSVGQGW